MIASVPVQRGQHPIPPGALLTVDGQSVEVPPPPGPLPERIGEALARLGYRQVGERRYGRGRMEIDVEEVLR